MHSIERYGIVALLFLVVTVIAVLMWDGNRETKTDGGSAALTPATPARLDASAGEPRAESDAGRHLSLLAERQPGPLQRNPRGRARANAVRDDASKDALSEPAALRAELDGGLDAELEPELSDDGTPLTGGGRVPPERPAPEQVIGSSEPAPTLSAPAAVPATHAYTVRTGDTLSEIAQRELGSARRWQELVAANPGLDPAKLRVGKTIQVPGAKAAAEVARASEPKGTPAAAKPAKGAADGKQPGAAGGKTWKVGKGENLWRIAERALGDGKRWGEIARLNPKVDPDRLVLGQVLALPSSASTGAAPTTAKGGAKGASTASKAPTKVSPKGNEPVLLASAGATRRGSKVK